MTTRTRPKAVNVIEANPGPIPPTPPPVLTTSHIAMAVCEVFELSMAELCDRTRRHRDYVNARAAFAAFCKMEIPRIRFKAINHALGGADTSHSTVIDAHKRFWRLIKSDEAIFTGPGGEPWRMQDIVDRLNEKLGTKCLVGHPPRDGAGNG